MFKKVYRTIFTLIYIEKKIQNKNFAEKRK